jgi:uncharacterized DUF497 family protein
MSGKRRRARIEALERDDTVLNAIAAQHDVSIDEIEQVCLDPRLIARRRADGALKLLGRTRSGRFLAVLLVERGAGVWAPVTARGMTGREWRLYQGVPEP